MTTSALERAPTSAFLSSRPRGQAKLRVSAIDNPLECHADKIAEQATHTPDPAPALVQRCTPGGCDDEVLRLSTDGEPSPANTGSSLHALSGRGDPLPMDVRSFFEPRFGTDFSNVRIHTDNCAARLTADYSARAFTVQRDIVFGHGEYAPSTRAGRRLLAHELTHVIQQDGGVRRQPSDETSGEETEGVLEIEQAAGSHAIARTATTRGPLIQRVCNRSADEVGYPVEVNLAIPATPASNRSLTTAQISQRAEDPSGRTAGLTVFRAQLRWELATRTAGGRSWVTRFRAFFRNASIRIFLTRDLPEGSCELADLGRHERRHDADFRDNAAEAEPSICDTAGTWPSNRSNAFPITQAQLRGLVADWMAVENWRLAYENWLDACIWDTVDYPRLYAGCDGTNYIAPEARCGDSPTRPAPQHTLPLPEKAP